MMPNQIIVCDIEATHKVVSCAEIITIAMIKTDLDFNVIDQRDWKMAPTYWTEDHDAASDEAHKITRDEAMQYPNKKETLRDIFRYISGGNYIFAGHFNRDLFGMTVSYDYALLKQEFLDQSPEAYFKFGQIFDRKKILSSHTMAWMCHKRGLISVPLTIKEGNKKASYDFSLESICGVVGIPFDKSQYHGCVYDTQKTLELLKTLSGKINIFEVINNDWRDQNEQSDFTGTIGQQAGIDLHELWNCDSQILSGDEENLE